MAREAGEPVAIQAVIFDMGVIVDSEPYSVRALIEMTL